MTPNPSLAYEALDFCEANPAKYESLTWIAKFGTATVADFAGRVCLLSGDRPAYEPGQHTTQKVIVGEEVVFVADRAAQLLGVDRAAAGELLYDCASLAEVRRAVLELFGPRPAARYSQPFPKVDSRAAMFGACCPDRRSGFACTREPDHAGDHQASNFSGGMLAAWPQERAS